jgi:hypothetical protein
MTLVDEVTRAIEGKTMRAIRTGHDDDAGGRPHVTVHFDDGSIYRFDVKDNVFFEAAMFNGLRKAAPVVLIDKKVEIYSGITVLEVRAKTFPLFLLRVVDRKHLHLEPLTFTKVRDAR